MINRAWRLAAVTLALFAVQAPAQITIDQKPPVVERRHFDPNDRPPRMPPLHGPEAAVTQSGFECGISVTYEITHRQDQGGQCTESLRVHGVQVVLQLKVIIWLPNGARRQLVDHEEGHRLIAQRVYDDAPSVARELARALDGKTLTARGPDCDAAEQQATQSLTDNFCRDYLQKTGHRAAHIDDAYDAITAHGTRSRPSVEEAIRQAFAREEKRASAATAPGSTQR